MHERDWKLRKSKESLIIDSLNPMAEMKVIINLEKVLKIDPCWRTVAPEIQIE